MQGIYSKEAFVLRSGPSYLIQDNNWILIAHILELLYLLLSLLAHYKNYHHYPLYKNDNMFAIKYIVIDRPKK